VLRRCVWSRNIKNGCSIYIYDISRLRVKFLLVADRRYQMKAIILWVCFPFETGRAVLSTFSFTVWTIRSMIPDKARNVSFPNHPDRFWSPRFLLFNNYRCYFSTVELPKHDVHHWLPTIADIGNVQSCITNPPVYYKGVVRGDFTRTFTLNMVVSC